MLTLGKRQAQIFVDMPSDSVSLRIVSYDKIKFFEYTVTFLVNPLLAYQQNVRSANISIAYKQVSKIFKLFPRNQDTRSAVINEKLKNMTQLRRNFNKTTDEEIVNNIIFSSNLSCSSPISPSELRIICIQNSYCWVSVFWHSGFCSRHSGIFL